MNKYKLELIGLILLSFFISMAVMVFVGKLIYYVVNYVIFISHPIIMTVLLFIFIILFSNYICARIITRTSK